MGFFKKHSKENPVTETEAYTLTIKSTANLAIASYGLLAKKPPQEQTAILGRAMELALKVQNSLAAESPLLVSLTLLTAIDMHEFANRQK